jgi:phage repressor protein C with HTH and peptisase S24 domain
LPGNAIRYALEGRATKSQRLAEICDALGLELYVGPPRPQETPATVQSEASTSSEDIKPPAWAADLLEEIADIRERLPERSPVAGLEDTGALVVGAVPDGARTVPGARPVQMVEMEAAAGDGANIDDARIVGPVWFRRDWIESRGIDPTQAIVITVRNDSMEKTLPQGCKILVDRARRRRRVDRIFVVSTEDGLIVKRMGRGREGDWLLVSDSDSPDWPDRTWPRNAEVIGEVRWMAREFP